MKQVQENAQVLMSNGLDLEHINKLSETIQTYFLGPKTEKEYEIAIKDIAKIINLMPCRKGSVKVVHASIPWDHFVVLADIFSAGNEDTLAAEMRKIAVDRMKKGHGIELITFQKKLEEIKLTLLKEKEEEKDSLDILLTDITEFDKDDSLEKEVVSFENLQTLTAFYRDHSVLKKIQDLFQQSENIEINVTTGKTIAGLVIALAEQIKKLSYNRRIELAAFPAAFLGRYEQKLLDRLWLYKKSRDAIRHAADFPKYQLRDLQNILNDTKEVVNILTHMQQDGTSITTFCNEKLQKELLELEKCKNVEKKFIFLQDKFKEKKEKIKDIKDKKKEKAPRPNVIDILPTKIAPEFIAKDFDENSFNALIQHLKKTNPKHNEQQILDVVEQLKKFLLSGDLSLYLKDQNFTKESRGKLLAHVKKTLGIFALIKDLDKRGLPEEKDFYIKICNFIEKAFVGEKVVSAPVMQEERKKTDDFWGKETLINFVKEICAFAKENIFYDNNLLKKLNEKVYMENASVDLHYFLFVEFLSQGFHMDIEGIKVLRQFTGTNEKKFDEVFEKLTKGQKYSSDPAKLDTIYRNFSLFFFGDKDREQFFAKASGAKYINEKQQEVTYISTTNQEVKNKCWLKVKQQFDTAFMSPADVHLRNNGEARTLEYFSQGMVSLKPWEEDYENIKNPLLNIRMLLSSKYRAKIHEANLKENYKFLNPSVAIQKFQLHIDEIKNLLEETSILLEEKQEVLTKPETLKEVVELLDLDAYPLILNMAHISEHVLGINHLISKYLIPYVENPPKESPRTKENKGNSEILSLLKDYLTILRSCGNSLAHMDLAQSQQLKNIFSVTDITNILTLIKETVSTMEEIISLVPYQLMSVRIQLWQKLRETYDTIPNNQSVTKKESDQFIKKFTSQVMGMTYQHSFGGLCRALDSFGFHKAKPVQEEVKDNQEQPLAVENK